LVVHCNQNRSSFQELHLLVLGNEKLGSIRPFRRVFPPGGRNKSQQTFSSFAAQQQGIVPGVGPQCTFRGRITGGVGGGGNRGTNKCLVKQLLCLYPFPQCSQRSSGRLNLRPSLAWDWPSLALRPRAFWKESPSSGDAFSWSSMALSWCSCPSMFVYLWTGMLAGGEGRPAAPDLDIRRLLILIGRAGTLSFMSPIAAAAAAATMFALLLETLLRRATRWEELRGPGRTVWEFVREWDCLAADIPGRELGRDGRCVNGLVVCRISCD
jgi:hypothetical protein